MSTPPAYQKSQPLVAEAPRNGLGTAGFFVSLLGLVLTCGVLCPIGLLMSVIAVFKRPRGMAIAGLVIGGIGTVWLAGLVGMGIFVANLAGRIGPEGLTTIGTGMEALTEIEQYKQTNGTTPDEEEGNELVGRHIDGWDTPLRYESEGDDYVIRTAGPDGQFDTSDDWGARMTAAGQLEFLPAEQP